MTRNEFKIPSGNDPYVRARVIRDLSQDAQVRLSPDAQVIRDALVQAHGDDTPAFAAAVAALARELLSLIAPRDLLPADGHYRARIRVAKPMMTSTGLAAIDFDLELIEEQLTYRYVCVVEGQDRNDKPRILALAPLIDRDPGLGMYTERQIQQFGGAAPLDLVAVCSTLIGREVSVDMYASVYNGCCRSGVRSFVSPRADQPLWRKPHDLEVQAWLAGSLP